MSGSLATLAGAALGFGGVGGAFARFLRPASLRGVGFWIVASEDATIRRWVTHEFPGRDDPWHEDLGAGPAAFLVEGLLLGDDVALQAQRLRRAAGKAGPARLVHPWYGTLQVAVLACEVSLAANEGRVARFRLRLERYGATPAPSIGAGLIGRVLGFVQDAADAVGEALAEVQSVIVMGDQAVGTVLQIASGLAGTFSRGLTGAGLGNVVAGTVTGQAIQSLAAVSPAEAADLPKVAARVDAVAVSIAALPADARNAALACLVAIAARPVLVAVPADRSTASAAAAADAAASLAASCRALIAARAAVAATGAGWATREDALADRDRLAAALDLAAEDAAATGWDDAWRQVIALRAAILAEISDRAAPLPRLRQLTLPAPTSAALLAFRLDGDGLADVFARGEAIAARNRAPHPGFLPAAVPVEVVL
jgi:prophage DNA circulation protein